ncbi:MAG: hypothetical protein JWR69_2306 [Pedosphaera sp.]|nr:hypothetical protein [Pedosphaera sp.]
MTQVETAALWIGLLSAVVSIVLSVVAILFARDVDRRSLEMTNQTIRSLEAIQSTVQRLSDDTGGLIKVAWERMLGTMGPQGDTAVQDMLPGLLAEFRQDANDLAPGTGVDKLARDVGERVRRATTRKSGTGREVAPRSWAFNAAIKAIESLSPLAIELLRALEQTHHLTRSQYQQLRKDADLALALDELRDQDILIPLQRTVPHGEETVYGLAPWFQGVIGPALVFTGHETPASSEAQRVMDSLKKVGFMTDHAQNSVGDGAHTSVEAGSDEGAV